MFAVILSYTLSDNIGEIKNIYLYYILSLGKCYDKKKNAVNPQMINFIQICYY